jgi:hypothetical protein
MDGLLVKVYSEYLRDREQLVVVLAFQEKG